MTKHVFILLSVLTGFFLLPKPTYACGSKSATVETSCCQEGRICTKENESCCSDHHSKTGADDCGGGCGHNSCHCPSVAATALPYSDGVKHYIFNTQKERYYLPDLVLPSGFYSIWLPPKIS